VSQSKKIVPIQVAKKSQSFSSHKTSTPPPSKEGDEERRGVPGGTGTAPTKMRLFLFFWFCWRFGPLTEFAHNLAIHGFGCYKGRKMSSNEVRTIGDGRGVVEWWPIVANFRSGRDTYLRRRLHVLFFPPLAIRETCPMVGLLRPLRSTNS